ncbi:hypothetical protein ROHU_016534 [Labeo rohita]|uniref:Uncharacterized protein n=1 Tax=Labeo rohita TaxID=84645 RepID=A0A498NJE8_LABRO|nr:hypothetical protein ROHU_016534 [Labeo rohita]
MPAERLRKLHKQICQRYEIRKQELKRLHIEALLEQRRQKRLARALCPPVKPVSGTQNQHYISHRFVSLIKHCNVDQ